MVQSNCWALFFVAWFVLKSLIYQLRFGINSNEIGSSITEPAMKADFGNHHFGGDEMIQII